MVKYQIDKASAVSKIINATKLLKIVIVTHAALSLEEKCAADGFIAIETISYVYHE
jgi:hypothetical protein